MYDFAKLGCQLSTSRFLLWQILYSRLLINHIIFSTPLIRLAVSVVRRIVTQLWISRVLSSQNLVRDARYIRYSCGPFSDSPLSHAWKWRTQVGKRITGIPCVNVFRTLSLFPVWTIEESKVIELNPGPDIITTVYRIIIVFRR